MIPTTGSRAAPRQIGLPYGGAFCLSSPELSSYPRGGCTLQRGSGAAAAIFAFQSFQYGPQAALGTFRLADRFQIELFAAESLPADVVPARGSDAPRRHPTGVVKGSSSTVHHWTMRNELLDIAVANDRQPPKP